MILPTSCCCVHRLHINVMCHVLFVSEVCRTQSLDCFMFPVFDSNAFRSVVITSCAVRQEVVCHKTLFVSSMSCHNESRTSAGHSQSRKDFLVAASIAKILGVPLDESWRKTKQFSDRVVKSEATKTCFCEK